jgi:hypothetical protein
MHPRSRGSASRYDYARVTSVTDSDCTRRAKPRERGLLYGHYRVKNYMSVD